MAYGNIQITRSRRLRLRTVGISNERRSVSGGLLKGASPTADHQRETGVRVSTSLLVLHEPGTPLMQPFVVCLIVSVEPSPDGPMV